MAALRFMVWNALLLIRRPFQFFVRVFMFISLGAAIGGVVMIFTGTGASSWTMRYRLLFGSWRRW